MARASNPKESFNTWDGAKMDQQGMEFNQAGEQMRSTAQDETWPRANARSAAPLVIRVSSTATFTLITPDKIESIETLDNVKYCGALDNTPGLTSPFAKR